MELSTNPGSVRSRAVEVARYNEVLAVDDGTESLDEVAELIVKCGQIARWWSVYITKKRARHESTGFSPFEIVFGRTIKGAAQVLRQLMTDESIEPETKTTYQYVLDLRSRIQETCKLAFEESKKSQISSKIQFDKRAKHRSFLVGDQVLLLLSSKSNCLEYHFSGPFKDTKIVGLYDYEIELDTGKRKIFHINMIKKYFPRSNEFLEGGGDDSVQVNAIANVVDKDEVDPSNMSMDDSEMIIHYNTRQKESYLNVKFNERLSENKLKEARKLVEKYRDIFSDVPSVTNLLKHKIVLNSSVPVRAKPYTVPLHLIKQLDQELDSMLEAGIIEPSQSFYASPIVLIKKPNGDLRVCVNYKNLNKISLFDPEPAVNADDIFDKLGGCTILLQIRSFKGILSGRSGGGV